MPLRLASFDDVEQALTRLSTSPGPDDDGPWLAWAIAHAAQSIELSLVGFPRSWPRLLQATVGRAVKRKFLRQGFMRHDLAAPVPGAEAIDATEVPPAIERLRRAIASFRAHAGPLAPHPVYGPCTRDEYERLHAMHVADHLG